MEIPAKYNPAEVEDKWYKYWMDKGFFHSEPDDREPYTIVIPPPNVTGVLHMGHMLNNTIQDVLVRRARMLGKNACWVPGTDHASIATEAKVVAKLRAEGIEKNQLTRDEFLKHAWEWREKHGGIILEQLKKLGASCDWQRTVFTMDEERSRSVTKVFVDLYEKGYIKRDFRMVNWDPKAKTTLSDEEVIYKEENSKLYYLKYKVDLDYEERYVIIATTRPETILGDTAVCVNPNDERFKWLKSKRVLVPLINRVVPVIEDEYVDMEFGTGCLKVTPAHDINDYALGIKYGLNVIDIFNDDATISEAVNDTEAGSKYIGMDRFDVRKQIIKDIENAGLLEKVEDYKNKVGYSERTDVVIEPRLSRQWFLQMKELAKPALDAVMDDTIKFHPAKFKNIYRHWMENIRDWNISRQLWWGHRIPAYYVQGKEIIVKETKEEALAYAKQQYNLPNLTIDDLKQDEDCLDTWFSSWLWPISVFDGINNPNNPDINYYYPTNDLVTAPEIIFFWVARMIMAGYEYKGEPCFHNVYFTGIVRDKQGRKMSKSLGNSPDPIDLIEKYSADGIRMGMLLCSAAGNDILFDESQVEQGRNFCNKIWNVFRLIKGWQIDDSIATPDYAKQAVGWFDAAFNKALEGINDNFEKYRISEALMDTYKLFWDDFSSWYLELVKPVYGSPIDRATYEHTIYFFDNLLKILHPFMPFITEEIWHYLAGRNDGESIMVSLQPEVREYNNTIIRNFDQAKEVITTTRSIRQDKNLSPKEELNLYIKGEFDTSLNCVLTKLGNLQQIEKVDQPYDGAAGTFLIGTTEFYVPLGSLLNVDEERKKLTAELEYLQGFRQSVLKKLDNEKFVSGAPEQVVDNERKKLADADTKIKAIEEQIARLS